MPPKQKVDLDLDALAPPNRTVRLRGNVYELPGDIGIDTIVRAMQLSQAIEAADESDSMAAIDGMLEIIYDLFRECNPKFEPMTLTMGQMMHILGLIMSGMDIEMDEAVRETLIGQQVETEAEEKEDGSPPTSLARARAGRAAAASRSRKLSPAHS